MKLVYIAGPYRAATGWGIEQNIVRARQLGAQVATLTRCYPVIPHGNTAHFDGIAPDAYWLEGGLELLRRCDCILLMKGWTRSSGTRAEKQEAERIGLPVFESIEELKQWEERQEAKR